MYEIVPNEEVVFTTPTCIASWWMNTATGDGGGHDVQGRSLLKEMKCAIHRVLVSRLAPARPVPANGRSRLSCGVTRRQIKIGLIDIHSDLTVNHATHQVLTSSELI